MGSLFLFARWIGSLPLERATGTTLKEGKRKTPEGAGREPLWLGVERKGREEVRVGKGKKKKKKGKKKRFFPFSEKIRHRMWVFPERSFACF